MQERMRCVHLSAPGCLNILEHSGISEQFAELSSLDASLLDCTISSAREDADLELVGVRLGQVHRFAEDFGGHHGGLLQGEVFAVVIFELAHSVHAVLTRNMSFPSRIVARRVRAVELEALNGVVASVHERDTEGAAAAIERVDMLLVGQVAHELLNVNGAALAVEVALGMDTAHINKHVGISDDTRDRTEHVVVHLVKLATLTSGHEERGSLLLLSGEDHTYKTEEKLG